MKRYLIPALALVGFVAVSRGQVAAQYPYSQQYGGYGRMGGYGRPGLSPYLNMLRGGSPAANYYLGVLPEFERRALDVQFGSALLDLERRAASPAGGEDEELLSSRPGTGHPAVFGYYQPYYSLGRPAIAQPSTGFGRPTAGARRGR